MISSSGLRYLNQLRLGIDEMQWLQEYGHVLRRDQILGRMAAHGLVLNYRSDGIPDDTWAVLDQGGGQIALGRRSIQFPGVAAASRLVPARAVDGQGTIFGYDAYEDFDPGNIIPDDSTWYTVVVSAAEDQYEPGTVQLFAGGLGLTGTNTRFTRYSGFTTDGYSRGTLLRIAAADSPGGNAGTYEVDTVISDTSLTLRTPAIANEVGIPFTVAGDFLGASPADPDIHNHREVLVAAVAGPLREPNDRVRLILADVRRTGAVLDIIDRRTQTVYREIPEPRGGLMVRPAWQVDAAGAMEVLRRSTPKTSVVIGMTEVYLQPGRLIVVYDNVAAVEAHRFDARTLTWGAASVVVNAAGSHPTVVAVPFSDRIHCLYVRANILRLRTSTDLGATWAAEVDVWNPTAIDPLDTVDHPHVILLRNHRILVVAEYDDNSLGVTQAKVVFSDDYGTTWDTNANAGYAVTLAGDGNRLRPYLAQAQDDALWCFTESAIVTIAPYVTYNTLGTTAWSAVPTIAGVGIAGTTAPFDPAAWIAPDGQILLVAHEFLAANTQYLAAQVLSHTGMGGALQSGISLPQLQVGAAAGGAVDRSAPVLLQLRSGHLLLGFVPRATADPTILLLDVIHGQRLGQGTDVRTDL